MITSTDDLDPLQKVTSMPGMKPTMDEFKAGTLRSGSQKGPIVTNPKQAIAIGLNDQGNATAKPHKARRSIGAALGQFMRAKKQPPPKGY